MKTNIYVLSILKIIMPVCLWDSKVDVKYWIYLYSLLFVHVAGERFLSTEAVSNTIKTDFIFSAVGSLVLAYAWRTVFSHLGLCPFDKGKTCKPHSEWGKHRAKFLLYHTRRMLPSVVYHLSFVFGSQVSNLSPNTSNTHRSFPWFPSVHPYYFRENSLS
jgi:hypothetical protein